MSLTNPSKAEMHRYSPVYNTNINRTKLFTEIIDCSMRFRNRTDSDLSLILTKLNLLFFIVSYGNDVFLNLRICLQIMLTVAFVVASYEKSLSLTYLHSSVGQAVYEMYY